MPACPSMNIRVFLDSLRRRACSNAIQSERRSNKRATREHATRYGVANGRKQVMSGAFNTVVLRKPYLLFLGDATEPGYAKTAFGLRDWARGALRRRVRAARRRRSTGLPELTRPRRPRRGRAVAGDRRRQRRRASFPHDWVPLLVEALEAGLDIVSGMHARLADVPRPGARRRAARGARLIDVRVPPPTSCRRHRPQAQRQAAAHRRHRLRARQEIYRARARPRVARARARRRFPRHRADRHHDRRRRHPDRCGGRRFRRRRRRDALAATPRPTIGT